MQYSREIQEDRILIVKYYLQVLFVANIAIDNMQLIVNQISTKSKLSLSFLYKV